ncbi:MAG: hypothetical protein WC043_10875 [Pseudobdellovibrionaceae bacterium]
MSRLLVYLTLCFVSLPAFAAVPAIPFTVTMSEAVNVTGSPRIVLDVDGNTRYAVYAAGTGTASLTFTYTATSGDVDLNGVGIASTSVDLNGGTVTDLNGNPLANLTFTAPANMASVNVNYPSLAMDFTNDADGRYSVSGTVYNDLTSFLSAMGGSFTRASTATYFDSTGTLQTAAINTPRFDYDPVTHVAKGILIEESRTNSITNSTMAGSVLGILGSGGVFPTGWNKWNYAGISHTVTGLGTILGMSYIDIRVSGTNSSGSAAYPDIIVQSNVPASTGQSWTTSAYVQLIAGDWTGVPWGPNLSIIERDSGGTSVGGGGTSVRTASWTRTNYTRILASASVAKIEILFDFPVSAGASVDFTFRVAVPQLEQGAFSTSFIPTAGSTGTRAADILTIPTTSWYGSTDHTLAAQFSIPYLGGTNYPGGIAIDNGTNADAVMLLVSDAGGDQKVAEIWSGGIQDFYNVGAAYSAGTSAKYGVYYATNMARASIDGVLGALDNSVNIPSVTTLRIGRGRGGNYPLNGNVQKVRYYPLRVSNTQLQLLTQ